MNILTQSKHALIARIQQITQANGYRTDIGFDVRTGWLNDLLQQDKLPGQLAVVQRTKARQPETKPAGIIAAPGFLVVGLVEVDAVDCDEQLDAMELDILQALLPPAGGFPSGFPKGVTGWSLGPPEPFTPGTGQRHAGVAVPIYITTIIQEQIRR